MIALVTSIASRAITIGDVAMISGIIIGSIVVLFVGYLVLSAIAKGWNH